MPFTFSDLPAIDRTKLPQFEAVAWSFSARKQGRDANSWQEARAFANLINSMDIHETTLGSTMLTVRQ